MATAKAVRPRRDTGRHAKPDALSNTLAKQRRNSGKHRAKESPDDNGSMRIGGSASRSNRYRAPVPRSYWNRNYSGILVAEYLAAVGLSSLNIFVGDESYHERLSKFFVQVSALTIVFFLLALVAQSESSGKFATAFGGLIDVAILFRVAANGTISNVNGALHGASDNPTATDEQLKTV